MDTETSQHRREGSETETEPHFKYDIAESMNEVKAELERLKLKEKLLEDKRRKAEEEEKERWSKYYAQQEEKELLRMMKEDELMIQTCIELAEMEKDAKKEIELLRRKS